MSDYTLVIIITFVAFTGLAALLLVPVYRFLKREEEASSRMSGRYVPEEFDVAPSDRPSNESSEQPSDETTNRSDRSDRSSDTDS